jgi:hypothetical protein
MELLYSSVVFTVMKGVSSYYERFKNFLYAVVSNESPLVKCSKVPELILFVCFVVAFVHKYRYVSNETR